MNQTQKIKDTITKCINDILSECEIIYPSEEIKHLILKCLEDTDEILKDEECVCGIDSDDSQLHNNEHKKEFVGECCFCGDQCNPLSQSCGSCSRGISGSAIGIPIPEHLKLFFMAT